MKKQAGDLRQVDWKNLDIMCIKAPCGYNDFPNPTPKQIYLRDKTLKEESKLIKEAESKLEEIRHKQSLGNSTKDSKWIIYGLIVVGGYFAYKKFKK